MLPTVPKHPPLEVVKKGQFWLVEEYRQGKPTGTAYSTQSDQIAAVRAAKSKMDSDRHPCVLQWGTPESVQNLYWNPLFECLEVEYDPLAEIWAISPEETPCVISFSQSMEAAFEQAKRVQRDYNFKRLRAYNRDGTSAGTRKHRFLRYEITKPGVQFDPEKTKTPVEPQDTENSETASGPDLSYTKPTSLTQLDISIPDITKVELVDTSEILLRYRTPWGDGTQADILLISRKYAATGTVQKVFTTAVDNWRDVEHSGHVSTVYRSGTEPTPWVAYRSDEQTLADVGLELSPETRLDLIEQLMQGAMTMTAQHNYVCGIRPENISLRNRNGEWQATIANWTVEWVTKAAVGVDHITPFVAPEQARGTVTASTCVYQLGAVAYWLLCKQPPVEETAPRQALQNRKIRKPETITDVSDEIEDVLETALQPDPSHRYESVEALRTAFIRNTSAIDLS